MSTKYQLIQIRPKHFVKLLKTERSIKSNRKFLIIPGNPGVVEFYEQFANDLSVKCNANVYCISHTGHLFDETLNGQNWTPIDVATQLSDKVEIIEKHLRSELINGDDDELVVVGHSIGCYVILEIVDKLSQSIGSRIKKIVLLFPTIERMSETPNGKILTVATRYFLPLIYLVAYLLASIVPMRLRHILVDRFFARRHQQDRPLNDNVSGTVIGMSRSFSCFRSCLFMGKDEMDKVRHLNREAVKRNAHRLIFYYGTRDRWCPIELYESMRKYVEDFSATAEINNNNSNSSNVKNNKKSTELKVDDIVKLDRLNLEHGFVIHKQQCEQLANLVNDWL